MRRAEELGCGLRELTEGDLCAIDERLAGSREVWDFERSVEQRAAVGGTARAAVLAQIEGLRRNG